MTAHTPSPWHACEDGECPCGHIWAADDNTHIATVLGPRHQGDGCATEPPRVPSRAEQIANAKLIASAPQLLKEIEQLRATIARLQAELAQYEGEL